MPMTRLVFGCGYLGERIARLWLAAGDAVMPVTRSDQRLSEFRAQGFAPFRADVADPPSLDRLFAELATRLGGRPLDTLLFAVGYDRSSGRTIREVYVDGLGAVLDHATAHDLSVRTIIYVSSTGVYGQSDSQWVDETSSCRPVREGGVACLQAEQRLQNSPLGDRSIILRCAGLYGPGRIPHLQRLRADEPIPVPPDGFVNLIHIDDAARIAVDAADRLSPPQLLNVSDGHPAVRREYYAEVARLIGAPPPRYSPPAADSPVALRAGSDKRVSNVRLVEQLGTHLLYPSYREGLRACLSDVSVIGDTARERSPT